VGAQNTQHAPFCYTVYRYNTPHKPGISAVPAGLNKLVPSGVFENPMAVQPCLLLALQCHVFVYEQFVTRGEYRVGVFVRYYGC
jgi:hypothetical protein